MQKKEKIQLIVTGVMALILVAMLLPKIANSRKQPAAPVVSANKNMQSSASEAGGSVPAARLLLRKKVKEDRFFDRFTAATAVLPLERNPFEKGNAGPKDPRAALALDGIMWDDVKPMAIINQQFLNVGDLTGPFKVVKISKDKVTLQDADSQFDLLLNQNK